MQGTPYAHRLSHQQPATAAPPPAVDALSRSWQRVSVTRAPANPHNTRLLSSYNQVVHTGGSLSAKTEGETVLVTSSAPPNFYHDGGGRLILPPSSTPSPRSRDLAMTEELCDAGSSGTTTARAMKENGKTAMSISTYAGNSEFTTGTPTASDVPDRSPSTTTTSDTATTPVDTDSMFDQLRRAQPISRQSVVVLAGAASAGTAIFILTFVLHRCVHRWASRRRTGVIWVGRESNANAGSYIELLSCKSRNPEVSYFSGGS